MLRASLLAIFLGQLLSGLFVVRSQEPLATTTVDGRRLELWAHQPVKVTPFDLHGDMSFPAALLDRDSTEPEVPWKDSHISFGPDATTIALGFLLREPDGTVSSDLAKFSVAHQVKVDGETYSYRDNIRRPSEKFSSCRWPYSILPSLIVRPGELEAASIEEIEELTGYVSLQPQVSARITFTKEELMSKRRKAAGLFSIKPVGSKRERDGTIHRFEMFYPKPTSKDKSSSMDMMMMQASASLPTVSIETTDGEFLAPTGQMRIAQSRQQHARVQAAVRAERRLRNQDPETRSKRQSISLDYSLDIDVFAIKIPKADIKEISIEPGVATGMPEIHAFSFESFRLGACPSPSEMKSFIEKLKPAPARESEGLERHSGKQGESLAITESNESYRTWRDSSGKFTVVAALQAADTKSVKLKREDGSVVTVPRSRLSLEDGRYLRSLGK